MSKIKNRVLEALQERNISIKEFCLSAKLSKNTLYDLDKFCPSLKNAIKMSNSLNLTIDYLLGRNDDDTEFISKNDRLKFYDNLVKILESKNISKLKFCKDLNLSTDAFTRWKKGAVPYLSTVVVIANYLNIEIEYLLGRKI